MLRRLYKIRFGTALILALPFVFLCVWYAAQAVVAHARYNRAVGIEQPLTAELFHLHLYDLLHRDLDRLTMEGPEAGSELPIMALHLGNPELDKLNSKLPPGEGKGRYVEGLLKSGREVLKIEARYRGGKHWHWAYPQKSWKVRVVSGLHLDGRKTFNLVNTPDPLPVSEELILGVARKIGLLTPEHVPFRLLLNNVYLGIHFFSAQPDASLARLNHRAPGALFSGNGGPIDPASGVSALFGSSASWKRVEEKKSKEPEDMSALDELLRQVNTASQEEFARYARMHLDLEKFAKFDALDVVFGGNEHDFHQNHKLYWDQFRGRLEPVAWSFHGFEHREVLNRTENPLLIRLKDVPEYLTRRNREVWRLTQDECSFRNVSRRAESLLQRLRQEQANDPYWDAYHLLPSAGRYLQQMVRPMDLERQALVFKTRMQTYARRLEYLERTLASAQVSGQAALLESGRIALDVAVEGNCGVSLLRIVGAGPGCEERGWSAVPEGVAGAPERHLLYPGSKLVAREIPHPFRGNVRSVPSERIYPFVVSGPQCRPEKLRLHFHNLVTDRLETLDVPVDNPSSRVADAASFPGQPVPRAAEGPGGLRLSSGRAVVCDVTSGARVPETLGVGHESIHPWCLPMEKRGVVTLGPGKVEIGESRIYGEHESVEVAAGTELAMDEGASLVFLGGVQMLGTKDAPISVVPAGKKPWGGIAVFGAGSRGSVLRRVHVWGGSAPSMEGVALPGMISIQDTGDVSVESSLIERNSQSDEAFSAIYVDGLSMVHTTIRDVPSDALDLEYSSVDLQAVQVVGAGDECIDLMDARVNISKTVCAGWGGNAISAGQGSRVSATQFLAADGNVGLLIKDASHVEMSDSLVYKCGAFVDVATEDGAYPGRNRLRGAEMYAVECREAFTGKGAKPGVLGSLETALSDGDLPGLLAGVVKVRAWSELDAFVSGLRSGGVP